MMVTTQSEKSIFLEAIECPAEERDEFLLNRCGDDRDLRSGVEDLLCAYEQTGDFLGVADSSATIDLAEKIGSVIGPYTLREQLGKGGMGVVYRAEQTEPMRREVALKLIKPGMDTQQVLTRFETERQALALMDHPNIAKVLDAGTTADLRNPDAEVTNEFNRRTRIPTVVHTASRNPTS